MVATHPRARSGRRHRVKHPGANLLVELVDLIPAPLVAHSDEDVRGAYMYLLRRQRDLGQAFAIPPLGCLAEATRVVLVVRRELVAKPSNDVRPRAHAVASINPPRTKDSDESGVVQNRWLADQSRRNGVVRRERCRQGATPPCRPSPWWSPARHGARPASNRSRKREDGPALSGRPC